MKIILTNVAFLSPQTLKFCVCLMHNSQLITIPSKDSSQVVWISFEECGKKIFNNDFHKNATKTHKEKVKVVKNPANAWKYLVTTLLDIIFTLLHPGKNFMKSSSNLFSSFNWKVFWATVLFNLFAVGVERSGYTRHKVKQGDTLRFLKDNCCLEDFEIPVIKRLNHLHNLKVSQYLPVAAYLYVFVVKALATTFCRIWFLCKMTSV